MKNTTVQKLVLTSHSLKRDVIVDVYLPSDLLLESDADLLLINDGQDLVRMNFSELLSRNETIIPLLVVGVHAGEERKMEYGVSGFPDYLGRGARATHYTQFVVHELLPALSRQFPSIKFTRKSLAGFSLGGLMAFDMLLDHPNLFSSVGVFSGSFWWRSKPLDDCYNEELDRIMHAKIRTRIMHDHLRFFLQTGQLDEKADRNNNGIIDSIDDTLDVILELSKLGYTKEHHINYVELPDGQHNIETWGRVFPVFLNWLFQKSLQ